MTPALKRLRWALALSLALNVFLLGFASARWLQRRSHWSADARHKEHPMRRLLGPATPELRAQRGELRAARREVGDALEAEPFDRERMARALAKLREETSEGQRKLHERLLERAATLSLEQRRQFAESRFFRASMAGDGPRRSDERSKSR